MGKDSNISWTDHTFNPWHGCAKVSEGCKFCYAEAQDNRWAKNQEGPDGKIIRDTHWGVGASRKMMSETYWKQLERWNAEAALAGQKKRVFVASMADVFEDRPELIPPRDRLAQEIIQCEHLQFLLLTKRPENVINLWNSSLWITENTIENLWIGCTAENQERLQERADHMGQIKNYMRPAVTFLSAEPLLTGLDLGKITWRPDWVIAGGESGPHARKMEMSWIRDLYNQCQALGIAFFKQTGSVIAKVRGYTHPAGAHQEEWDQLARLTYMSQKFPDVK